jgi:hypothetical protein
MNKIYHLLLLLLFLTPSKDQKEIKVNIGPIPDFEIIYDDITLERIAQSTKPMEKVGRKFAILGYEDGRFEAWAYPLKILRNFEFSFLIENSTTPIKSSEALRYITVTPSATIITYSSQFFTIKAIYITPIDEPGSIILLKVNNLTPIKIICSFIPVLQPMWPAGLGGQFSYWNDELKAYVISEPTGQNHGIIGSPLAGGISYTPAHMLSDTPLEFIIDIDKPYKFQNHYIPICVTGGKGKFDSVKSVYVKLLQDPKLYYQKTFEHYKEIRNSTLKIFTPDEKINLAFEWAKISYDNLMVSNPDLGTGLVAGLGASGSSGRPGFGWFFGGDAFINSFAINSYCAYSTTKDALKFTQKWQRNDGKMAHELTQSAAYVDWFGKYHYGYIHADTTPFYIVAMYDYFRLTNDIEFVKSSWKSLINAFEFCLSTDSNGDGLMDNQKAGLGAMEYGELTKIGSDIYLSAVWIKAIYAMSKLSEAIGENEYKTKTETLLKKAKRTFEEKLWDANNKYYAYAFNQDGKLVSELTPFSTVAIAWEICEKAKSIETIKRINSSELTTDWGIRILSRKSKYYNPFGYNYGAVWPFLSGWTSLAQFKMNFFLQGFQTMLSIAEHTFDNQLGYISEVFSGDTNIWLNEAVSHQGFSNLGVTLALVRGLLGLDADATNKFIEFSPKLPPNWDKLTVSNFKVGRSKFDISYQKNGEIITIKISSVNPDKFKLKFAPVFPPGTIIKGITYNNREMEFSKIYEKHFSSLQVEIPLEQETTIKVKIEPSLEFTPKLESVKIGDEDKNLKIIYLEFIHDQKTLVFTVEGIQNKKYTIRTLNPDKIQSVENAVLQGKDIIFQIPQSDEKYVVYKFSVKLK